MKIGDFVGRKKYNADIIFRIRAIKNDEAILDGVFVRLTATAELDDLLSIDINAVVEKEKLEEKRVDNIISFHKRKKHLTGTILHIDGDEYYLKKCLDLYRRINIRAYGAYIDEENIKYSILELIEKVNPDIIVLTGHDSYNQKGIKDLENYNSTKDFIEAIKEVRKHYSKDHIIIFAGGCQSNFEALIAAGANFASSPKRLNIDVYDPAIVAVKTAVTPFNQLVEIKDIAKLTDHHKDGINGIESYGKMRLIL